MHALLTAYAFEPLDFDPSKVQLGPTIGNAPIVTATVSTQHASIDSNLHIAKSTSTSTTGLVRTPTHANGTRSKEVFGDGSEMPGGALWKREGGFLYLGSRAPLTRLPEFFLAGAELRGLLYGLLVHLQLR